MVEGGGSFSVQNRRGIGADANPVRAFHPPGINETLTPGVGFAMFDAFHPEDTARNRHVSEYMDVQRLWRDLLLLRAGLRAYRFHAVQKLGLSLDRTVIVDQHNRIIENRTQCRRVPRLVRLVP